METEVTRADITAIRRRHGWSTFQLAKEVGCNQSTIWRMENGRLKIRGSTATLLAALRDGRWPTSQAEASA